MGSPHEQEPRVREAKRSTLFEEHFAYWERADPRIIVRLVRIIEQTLSFPFTGIGKPEPLRGNWSGYGSRRLTQEHRVIYRVTDKTVEFIGAMGHYWEHRQMRTSPLKRIGAFRRVNLGRDDTKYIMRYPAYYRRVRAAIREADEGRTYRMSLSEIRAELGS